jgi:hypothetical protein
MSISIHPELETKLRARAQAEGLTVEVQAADRDSWCKRLWVLKNSLARKSPK